MNRFMSDQYSSYAYKITIISCITTVAIPYCCYLFHRSLTMFLINIRSILFALTIMNPIITFLNFSAITRKIKILLFTRFKSKLIVINNQEELNKLYEKPQLNLYDKHAHIIKCLFFCMCYSHILAYAFPMTLISFFLVFIVEKFRILRVYSNPVDISDKLTRKYLDFVFFMLVSFGFSKHFIVVKGLSEGFTIDDWLILKMIVTLSFFYPFNYFSRLRTRLFNAKDRNLLMKYDEARLKDIIQTEYCMLNPPTKKPVLINWVSSERKKEAQESVDIPIDSFASFTDLIINHHHKLKKETPKPKEKRLQDSAGSIVSKRNIE